MFGSSFPKILSKFCDFAIKEARALGACGGLGQEELEQLENEVRVVLVLEDGQLRLEDVDLQDRWARNNASRRCQRYDVTADVFFFLGSLTSNVDIFIM